MTKLTEAQIYAEKCGGKCCIQTGPTTFLFSCHRNHLWERPLEVITKRYDWCPLCPCSRGERTSRYIFEDLLGKKFPSRAPKFLNGLRLDGYNEELQLAFEFNGKQHYALNPMFHKSGQDLYEQRKRDQKKRNICKEQDICLIEIPYNVDLYNFIRDSLIKNGYLQNCSN